jgi:hypothetical protein
VYDAVGLATATTIGAGEGVARGLPCAGALKVGGPPKGHRGVWALRAVPLGGASAPAGVSHFAGMAHAKVVPHPPSTCPAPAIPNVGLGTAAWLGPHGVGVVAATLGGAAFPPDLSDTMWESPCPHQAPPSN